MLKTKSKFLYLLSNSNAANHIEVGSVVETFVKCLAGGYESCGNRSGLLQILNQKF